MKRTEKTTKLSQGRRDFLKGVAVAGGVAATAKVGGAVAAVEEEKKIETATNDRGYQETDHVRAYYKSARV
jgi:nitrous oxide reductase